MKRMYCLILFFLMHVCSASSLQEALEQYSVNTFYNINNYTEIEAQNVLSILKFETYENEIHSILHNKWDNEILDESLRPKQNLQCNIHYFKKLDTNNIEEKYTIQQYLHDLTAQYNVQHKLDNNGFIDDQHYGKQLMRIGIITSRKNQSIKLFIEQQTKAFNNTVKPKLLQIYNIIIKKVAKYLYIFNIITNYNDFIRIYSIDNQFQKTSGLYKKNSSGYEIQNTQRES